MGADPEFMLVDDKGHIHSAIGIVEGTSEQRLKIKSHQFYYDNVLAECAIAPGNSRKKVIDSFRECFEIYAAIVEEHKLKLLPRAFHEYDESELKHEDARRVGCSIDRCAYKVQDTEPPKDIIAKSNIRSGGGHLHLGSQSVLEEWCFFTAPTVVLMDLFLGFPSLYIDHDPTSAARRKIYGQAGRYRIKEYGLEYRTLSNFWLASPKLVGLMYDLSEFVLDIVDKRFGDFCKADFDKYTSEDPSKAYKYKYDAKKVRKAIDTSTKDDELLDYALSKMPKGLAADLRSFTKPVQYDMYKEWGL